MKWEDMALVGRIARAHGIRGQVIVNPETDFPEERFHAGAEVFIERGGQVEARTVTTARFHRGRPVIGLNGVETMTDAGGLAGPEWRGALAGLEWRVPSARLGELPSDTFCRHDLIGCRVEMHDGRPVGVVRDVE